MDTSIFTDKNKAPGDIELKAELEKTYKLWNQLKEYVSEQNPDTYEEWNYSKSFGWGFRVRDKKRVIIYLMPQAGKFKASFVLGEKATCEAIVSKISKDIKDLISAAKVYAEGRGIRIDVESKKIVKDIMKIIDIKLSN